MFDHSTAFRTAFFTASLSIKIYRPASVPVSFAYRSSSLAKDTKAIENINKDLDFITSKDNSSVFDEIFSTQDKDIVTEFYTSLEPLGLGYWVEQYKSWIKGDFNLASIKKCASLPVEYLEAKDNGYSIIKYLQTDTKDIVSPLEARVILLGDGDVGKTSLVKRFFKEDINDKEKATPKIQIREQEENIKDKKANIHYWDFGGQVFLHSSHQLFLREKCVYIVMIKARESNERELVEYWLEHIRLFGKGSDTIIVQNKVDELDKKMDTPAPYDTSELKEHYPFVKGFYNISCKEDTGIDELKKSLDRYLDEVIKNNKMTREHLELKNLIRQRLKNNINAITQEECEKMFDQVKITKEEDKKSALSILDNLGVALNFKDIDKNWFIINPTWLSESIYYLLNTSIKKDESSWLSVEKLQDIFDKSQDDKAPDVPSDKFESLLNILVNFNLAYKDKNNKYRVPMLSPMDKPIFDNPNGECVGISIKMDYLLPKALFYNFMTKCGDEIVSDNIWQNGCHLSWGGCEAIIILKQNARVIDIKVYANQDSIGEYVEKLRIRILKLIRDEYSELDFDISLSYKEIEYSLKQFLSQIENNESFVYDKNGNKVDITLLKKIFLGEDSKIVDERHLVHPNLVHQINITQNNNQNTNIDIKITNIDRILIEFKSDIDDLSYDIDREGIDDTKIQKDITRIKTLIEQYVSNNKTDEVAVEEKKGILKSILKTMEYIKDTASDIEWVVDKINKLQELLS
jgi:small GTP-binding protein